MFDRLYYDLKAKAYERKEKKSEKYWKKEMQKMPVYCTTKEEFIEALNAEKETIIVRGDTYCEILESAKKSQASKNIKNVGVGAILAGAFILPGISAWIATGIGALAFNKGKADDSLKKYNVSVDEMKMEITLKR